MSKEADVKKIELKVSVNCCDGCKKKVKKVLQSIEGVLRTEVDPLQPKVTVLGNVDPQVLIKRLLKAGKQAELWIQGNQSNGGKEKDLPNKVLTKEQDKSASRCQELGKCSTDLHGNPTDHKHHAQSKASEKNEKEKDSSIGNLNTCSPEVVRIEDPLRCATAKQLQELNNLRNCNQINPLKVDPGYAIAVPYYAIPSYAVPTLLPTYYGQGYVPVEGMPFQQQPPQIPAAQVGDYFSDENTVGCHVM